MEKGVGMKKKSVAKMFVKSLLKSLLGLIIIIGVGFASYKISYMVLSNNSTNIGTSSDNIKNIIEDAQIDEVSKNLIYVCDGKKITHMMLEIYNTKTNNMDYLTIPAKTDFTIPTEMYQKLCTVNEEIPQIVRLSKLKEYFKDEADAFGYGELIIEQMIGTKISYYTVLDQKVYDSHYSEAKTKIKFKPQSTVKSDDVNNTGAASPAPSEKISVKQTISVASDAYIKQLKDLAGDEKKIAEYIKEQYDRVDSNLTVYNKIGYIESYKKSNVDYFHYWGIPGTFNGKIFTVDTKACKKYIDSLVNNEVTYTEAQNLSSTSEVDDSASTDNNVSSKGKNIIILNGSKITGLAASTKTKLTNAGYTVGNVGDYKDEVLTKTKIIVKEDGMGQDLANYFNDPEITVGTVSDGYDIQIILGTVDAN